MTRRANDGRVAKKSQAEVGRVEMTNREWLIEKLQCGQAADCVPRIIPPCDYCQDINDCLPEDYPYCKGAPDAWKNWLEAEHENGE